MTPTPTRPRLDSKAAQGADKQISLLAIMAKLGQVPLGRAAGGNYFYISPFRPEEKTPSFVVCEPKNVWSDFGLAPDPGQKAAGGDVLKLIMRLTGLDLPLARLTLRAWAADLATPAELALPLAPPVGETFVTDKVTFHDVRVEPLGWQPLVQYLESRGINWRLVQRSERTKAHLQQIFYRTSTSAREKPYFGLGWKTAAGWEVRSPKFQGTIGGKGLTWLTGQKRDEVLVFEGFLDYLSALTYYGQTYFEPTVLILNSVSMLAEALPTLAEAKRVHWFGDNDAAGLRALHLLRQVFTPAKVKAHNELYRGYKDFNDFLTKTKPVKPLPPRGAEPSQLSQTARYWLWVVFDERAPGSRPAAGKKRLCTFYSWTNDATGLDYLQVLRNRLGHQLSYYRLCERTTGRQYKILEWAGLYQPRPVTLALPADEIAAS
ncbi:MAG: toprim domain-containing protein [Janthinobacterium lividum]